MHNVYICTYIYIYIIYTSYVIYSIFYILYSILYIIYTHIGTLLHLATGANFACAPGQSVIVPQMQPGKLSVGKAFWAHKDDTLW